MNIKILTQDDMRAALTMRDAIAVLKVAFVELSTAKAVMPPRRAINLNGAAPDAGLLSFMPCYLPDMKYAGIKVGSVIPQNRQKGLPLIHALVLLMDVDTGQPVALLEGSALTALRTGAASGLATDLLARRDATSLAVIGAGVQARTQIEAVCCVRDITQITVFSKSRDSAEVLAGEVTDKYPGIKQVRVSDSAHQATKGADIVCTATTSQQPILFPADIAPGTHINAVGGHNKQTRELSADLLEAAHIVVENYAATRNESCESVMVELGEVINQSQPGRTDQQQITLFASVGVAVQDIAIAGKLLDIARQKHAGHHIEL